MDLRHPGTDSGGFNFGGGGFGGGGFGTQRDLARAWGEEIEKRLTGGTLDRENAARLARRWLRAEIQSGYFRVMPNEWPEDEPLRLVQFATPFDLRVRTNVTVALVTSHGTILAFAEVRPRFRYYSAGDPDPPFVESDDRTVLVPEAEFSAATVTGGFIEVDAIVAECLPQDLAKHIAAASPAIIAREQLTLELPRRRAFAECMTVQDGSDLDARVVASLAWCLPATDSNQHVDDGGPVDIEILLDESNLIDEVVIAGELRLERDGQVVAFGEVVIPTWLPAGEARISIELRASSRPGAEQSSWALQALTRPRTTAEAYPQSEWARDRLVLRANPRLAIRAHLRPTCWEGEIVVPRGTCSEW